jgi:hypothetical protein
MDTFKLGNSVDLHLNYELLLDCEVVTGKPAYGSAVTPFEMVAGLDVAPLLTTTTEYKNPASPSFSLLSFDIISPDSPFQVPHCITR